MRRTLLLVCIGLCLYPMPQAQAECSVANANEVRDDEYECPSGYVEDPSGEADCEAPMCCVAHGPVDYYWMRQPMDERPEWLWASWPIATGRCIRGSMNGSWTWNGAFQGVYGGDDQGLEPNLVRTGRYRMGIPTGAFVTTSGPMAIAAECYVRHRDCEDDDDDDDDDDSGVTYCADTIWEMDNANPENDSLDPRIDTEEGFYPDHEDYAPTNSTWWTTEPVKPTVDDFVDVERPELDGIIKPDRSDYDTSRDFDEAMNDYKYELKIAKADLKEAMKEYKALRREQLPEAKEKLKERMVAYKDQVKRHKAALKQFKAQSTALLRLAKACPKVTSDYCIANGECHSEGLCAHSYDKESKTHRCTAKTARHCETSRACKSEGKCTLQDGACVGTKSKPPSPPGRGLF